MLQRMTNPKENRDFVCLTWALRPGVTVCWVSSAPRWFKFLLEEEPITHSQQPHVICCWLIIHQVTDVLLLCRCTLKWCVCVCVPLCPACAGCPKSAGDPWDWTHPAPECPGCGVGGHGQRNCPSNFAGPPWPAAALHPVTNSFFIIIQFLFSYQDNKHFCLLIQSFRDMNNKVKTLTGSSNFWCCMLAGVHNSICLF